MIFSTWGSGARFRSYRQAMQPHRMVKFVGTDFENADTQSVLHDSPDGFMLAHASKRSKRKTKLTLKNLSATSFTIFEDFESFELDN